MHPAEFIIAQGLSPSEGVKLIAEVCQVCQSTVWYWLAGERRFKPGQALLLKIYTECTPEQRERWWPN